MQGKTVKQVKVGRFLIASHSGENPPDAEWDGLLQEYEQWPDGEDVRVVVVSEGGAPSTEQRARLTRLMKRRRLWVALITDSRFIRAIGVAVSWFNKTQRMFASAELPAALTFIGATASEAEQLTMKVEELVATWGSARKFPRAS